MKVLTKTRYKVSLECFNKLHYFDNQDYANAKKENDFLNALADGGFQVEELARMHYPDGVLLSGNDWDYKFLHQQTVDLLKRENVIIYEAAFLVDDLFIRADILVKKGNLIELIEVKSKSYDPYDAYLFVGKSGTMVSKWKPYLFDIAFQKYVTQLCLPDHDVRSYIMMADKSKKASINGLNQLFRVSSVGDDRTGILKKVESLEETGDPVLSRKEVTDIVEDIEQNNHQYHKGQTFLESISIAKEARTTDEYPNWPTSFSACKKCEFRNDSDPDKKSGFKECFQRQHSWSDADFEKSNTFDIYNFRKGNKLFDDGIFFKADLTQELIGYKTEENKLSTSHRQWLQIEKDQNHDASIYVETAGLQTEMSSWNFPLHFIDFETSTVALPFNKGLGPYEQVAFQFSHHICYEDGRIEHASEYINDQVGFFPNFEFVRALKKALENDEGTIFRYANHENAVLNDIYVQLEDSDEKDKAELQTFIQHITRSGGKSKVKWQGERDMVDLAEVVKKYYYNPLMKGSNSIKDVLPAAIESSDFLRNKYSDALGSINLTSKNFSDDHVWFQTEGGKVKNPYKILPAVFDDWDEEQLEQTLSEIDTIADGGAALTAYSKIQYTDISAEEIQQITNSLLKYCELDTLAMVMIYEHFVELVG